VIDPVAPVGDDPALVSLIHELRRRTPTIILTPVRTVRGAVSAMKAGAVDYLIKPPEESELVESIERALRMTPPRHPQD
jgi:FixJ family two-component response regulator